MLVVLSEVSENTRRDIVITGKEGNYYPEGKVHALGYAIDIRAHWPEDSDLVSQVRGMLECYSKHFKVLFGPPDHENHAHIGFAWWWAQNGQEADEIEAKTQLRDQIELGLEKHTKGP